MPEDSPKALLPPDRVAIGARLRTARKQSRVSVDKLAACFERGRAAYYHWEKGVAMPTADQLRVLCRKFGVTADELLFDSTDQPARSQQEQELIRHFRAAPEAMKNALLQSAHAYATATEESGEIPTQERSARLRVKRG